MVENADRINKKKYILDAIPLYLSIISVFLFSRRNIYWQGAATFCALFFVLIGLAFFFIKNKENIFISFCSVFALLFSTILYLISRKYNIFSYVDYIKIFLSFLVFIYGSLMYRKYGNNFRDSILKLLIHLLFFSAAISLFYYFLYAKNPLVYNYTAAPFISGGIIMGPWGYSNTFAIFMAMGALISQFFSIQNMEKDNFSGNKINIFFSKYFYDLLSALFISVMLITTSRLSIFIFILLWIFYVILILLLKNKYKKVFILKIVLITVASALIIFALVETNNYVFRLTQLKAQTLILSFVGGKNEYSGATRVYLIKFAFQEFSKNVFSGNGFGSFGFLLRKFTQSADYEKLIDPHSFLMKILSETGLLGFITIFIPILFIIFNKMINSFKEKNFSNDFIILFGGIAVFLHMNVDMDFVFPVSLFTLMLLFSLFDGKDFSFKFNNKILSCILIVCLICGAAIIAPKAISCSLLAQKDADYIINYEPDTLSLAQKLFPQNAYIWETMGENESNRILYWGDSIDKTDMAISSYKKYSSVINDTYLPYFNSGILLFNLGNKEAIADFKIAAELAPMVPETLAWYAFSRSIFLGDISEENVKRGQKSLDIYSPSYSGHLFFANYFRVTGQKKQMIKELKFLKANYPYEGLPYYIEYLYFMGIGDKTNAEISSSKAGMLNFNVARFEKGLN